MRYIVTLIGLLIAGPRASALSPADETATLEAISVLAPHVKTLDRELVAFTYQTDPRFDPKSETDIKQRLDGRPERFFDPTIADGNSVGPAVYLAADPANSRSYGGEAPHLFVLTLRADTRTLNAADPLTAEQLARTNAILADLKCGAIAKDLESFVKSMRSSANHECRAVIITAAQRLAIGAIAFEYFTPYPLPGCRTTRDAAIALIDSRALVPNTTAYYSHTIHLGPDTHRAFASALYQETIADPYRSWSNVVDMPKTMEGLLPTTQAYADWKSKYVLSCGPGRAAEGTFLSSDRVIDVIRRQHRDVDFRTLFARAKVAFFAKMNHGQVDFSLRKLLWLQRLEHRALPGGPRRLSFAQFQEAMDLVGRLYVSNLDVKARQARLATLIGEDVSALSGVSVRKLQSAYDLIGPAQFNILRLGRALGLQTRGSLLLANAVNDDGIPLLVRPRRSHQETVAASRALATRVLETCLKQYEDPTVSAEDIERSLCYVEQLRLN